MDRQVRWQTADETKHLRAKADPAVGTEEETETSPGRQGDNFGRKFLKLKRSIDPRVDLEFLLDGF
jgi:hypothetical protein